MIQKDCQIAKSLFTVLYNTQVLVKFLPISLDKMLDGNPERRAELEHSAGVILASNAPFSALYIAICMLLFAAVYAFYRELKRELLQF